MILLDVYEELLAKAEEMFGPRNPAYTLELIGFSFATPNRVIFNSANSVRIELSRKAQHWPDMCLSQLAHETVHTLFPITVDRTKIIEEGAATYFGVHVPTYKQPRYAAGLLGTLTGIYAPYKDAYDDVRLLMDENPQAIRDARKGRSFCDITSEEIVEKAPNYPIDKAKKLVEVFKLA
jgi:hypothetical protein